MDSEWVIESFLVAGIEVTPLLVVYEDGMNAHDMEWAERYIQRRKIKKVIRERLDLRHWYGSKAQHEIAWLSQTTELAYTTQYQAIQKLNDGTRFFITGYDEPGINAIDSVGDDGRPVRDWKLFYNERHYSVVKLFEQLDVPGIPNWGRWDSELLAAFICQPQYQMIVNNMFGPMVWNAELIKVPMYRRAFPFMESRPKFTGFETALDIVVDGARQWQDSVVERLGYKWNQEWSIPMHEAWDKLGFTRRQA